MSLCLSYAGLHWVEYIASREKDRNTDRKVEAGREIWIDMDGVATTISVCAPFIWQQIRETCHI